MPARALGGLPVARILEGLASTRGLPLVLRTDNGLEILRACSSSWFTDISWAFDTRRLSARSSSMH
jgi:hypothetical protein